MTPPGLTRGPLAPRAVPAIPRAYTICKDCGCSVDDACLVDDVPRGWATPYTCTRCERAQQGRAA